jgi:hypothetical protein
MRVRDPAANGYKTHSAIAPPVSGLAVLVLKPLLPHELTQYIDAERIGRLLWVADVMHALQGTTETDRRNLPRVHCTSRQPTRRPGVAVAAHLGSLGIDHGASETSCLQTWFALKPASLVFSFQRRLSGKHSRTIRGKCSPNAASQPGPNAHGIARNPAYRRTV